MDLIGYVGGVALETFRAAIEIADIRTGHSFGVICGASYALVNTSHS
jgi:hypothetical protein